jgi:ribonuclease D
MSIKSFFRRNLKKNKPIFIVDNSEELDNLDEELSRANIIGLDTEFDWRTTYFPKLSLIQIVANSKLFLLDCLKIDPSKVLKKYLESKNCLKIFHSVRSDATVLSKCLNIHSLNVFDIQIADQILTQSNIRSYGKIVKSFFGIELKKSETNSNWLKRPLTQNQIKYAFDDVDFLIEIYGYQKNKLTKKGILIQAFSKSEEEAVLGNSSLKKLRLERQKNSLSKKDQKIFLWREELAEQENVPPAYIFKDKHIKHLSKIGIEDEFAKKKILKILGDSLTTEIFIKRFL